METVQNEEVYILCPSDIISLSKSLRIRWVGHIAHVERMTHASKYCCRT
jgi:hypothetical protein